MAQHRHKRDTDARPRLRAAHLAGSVAVLATAGAVGLGMVAMPQAPATLVAADIAATTSGTADSGRAVTTRGVTVSRSDSRRAGREAEQALDAFQAKESKRKAERVALRKADDRLWTTAPLNVWKNPGQSATKVGEIGEGEKVLVTGRSLKGRVEIVVKGESRWVTSGYLSEDEPVAGIGGSCTNGSSVPSGVSPNVAKVHQAVCAAFPDITSYGTFRNDGEHSQGIAIDIMVSGSRGWEIAEFLREHYSELGISYLIYSQRIWSVQRGGEGWRAMGDRGSVTANHYDHVHVTTY